MLEGKAAYQYSRKRLGFVTYWRCRAADALANWRHRRQYTYGHCYRPDDGFRIENARLNKRTGRVEFVLWKAGEQGHDADYWHKVGVGWERYFISDPNDESNRTPRGAARGSLKAGVRRSG